MSHKQIKGFTGLAQLSMSDRELKSVQELALSNQRYVPNVSSPLVEWLSLSLNALRAQGFEQLTFLPKRPVLPKRSERTNDQVMAESKNSQDAANSLAQASPSAVVGTADHEVMVGIWGVSTNRRASVAKYKANLDF